MMDINEALNCTIEHLEGEHEGRVVVSRDVFEALYEAANNKDDKDRNRVQEAIDTAIRYVEGEDIGWVDFHGHVDVLLSGLEDRESLYGTIESQKQTFDALLKKYEALEEFIEDRVSKGRGNADN